MAKKEITKRVPECKIVSINGKHQLTIPKSYFEALGFGAEAECTLENNAMVIRPVKEITDENKKYFSIGDIFSSKEE